MTRSALGALMLLVALTAESGLADWADVAGDMRPSLATVIALRPAENAEGEGEASHLRLVGTGLFVTPSRLITSTYVVNRAEQVWVELTDGRRLPTAVLAGDRLSRVALLEVREPVGKPIDPASLRAPRLGQAIALMGAGYGFPNKLSSGLVAGLDRSVMDPGVPSSSAAFEVHAQADPGMSGAPVLAEDGAIVGIVLISTIPEADSRHAPLDGRQLLAYNLLLPETMPERPADAPPVIVANPLVLCAEGDTVRFAVEALLSAGSVEWGRIGMSVSPTPQDVVAHLGLGEFAGAVVGAVPENGPAAQAGLVSGDLLLEADGLPLTNGGDLMRDVLARPNGSVRLTYIRQGKRSETTVTLGALTFPLEETTTLASPEGGWLGALVAGASTALRAQLGLAAGVGLSVLSVAPGSPAETAGLRAGDVITEAAGVPLPVGDAEALAAMREACREVEVGETLSLTVLRTDGVSTLTATLAPMPDGYARFPEGFSEEFADL